MGSGYFPISKNSNKGKILSEAIKKISEVKNMLGDDFYMDSGQYDNAYYDGEYMEDLNIAIELIQKCLRD